MEFTEALRPLLGRYGNHPNLNLVVFTIDETVFSRELAPMAGFYRSLYVGVPWWFLDAPEAIRRFRGAVTETAGFYRTSGFIDDTRAFLSIPTRHDMSRRLDAACPAGPRAAAPPAPPRPRGPARARAPRARRPPPRPAHPLPRPPAPRGSPPARTPPAPPPGRRPAGRRYLHRRRLAPARLPLN